MCGQKARLFPLKHRKKSIKLKNFSKETDTEAIDTQIHTVHLHFIIIIIFVYKVNPISIQK